ncbi:MAG TPA: RluA family pseudouridine synthase [Stellaceae bacterium]|jgi:23S rRNA pseudouridine1911/1915/1917 synthase|nr:RluA family pseudouridine synthase [Stellaceae bacterium]
MGKTRTVIADAAAAGERLDRFLARALAPLSRTQAKRLIEAGQVAMAGAAATDPAAKIKPGQNFSVAMPDPVPDRPAPQAMALVIPYEDAHLLVVDKPAGLVVHPAPGNPDHTLVNALLAHCGDDLAGIGGVKRPGIVHRLDKDTSGLLVVAKTELAHRALSADFAARRVDRAYRAIVWGVPPAEGEIEGAIGRNPRDRKKMALVERGGKAAITRYRRLETFGMTAAMLECRLATGRTHQIRVHLASLGFPLVGDPVYGRKRAAKIFPRQALHAWLLGFRHPATGTALRFISEMPADMAALVKALRDAARST